MPQKTSALITAPRTLWNTNTAQEPEPSGFALTTYVRPQPRYSLNVFVDNVLYFIKVIKAPFSSESAFRVTSVPRLRATDFLLPWQTVRLQAPVSLQRVPGGRMGHVWESDNSQSLLSFPGTFINLKVWIHRNERTMTTSDPRPDSLAADTWATFILFLCDIYPYWLDHFLAHWCDMLPLSTQHLLLRAFSKKSHDTSTGKTSPLI